MCVALGIIGGIYAIFGGLKAVAVSDSLNGIIFIIGAVILIPVLAFIALGDGSIAEGIRLFATSSPEHLNAIQPANAQPPYIPWPMIVLGCGINHISYWCTNQSIMQRVLGAKNLKEAQKGSLLTGLTCVFCPIFLVAPGVIQFIRDGGVLTDFDMAYPSLIKDILPTPVLGFFAAVMFGAILSSFNSVLNSSMTLFTLDILPVISKRKRTDAQLITIAKRFGIVLCLASIIIAPFLLYLPAGISTFLNQMWGYYGVPVLAIVVMGILAPRMPSFAPKVAIIVHIVCYGLMMNLLPFHFLYFEVGAFVIDLILMAILTKAAPRKEAYVLPDLEVVDMTPWKYRKPVIAVTANLTSPFRKMRSFGTNTRSKITRTSWPPYTLLPTSMRCGTPDRPAGGRRHARRAFHARPCGGSRCGGRENGHGGARRDGSGRWHSPGRAPENR